MKRVGVMVMSLYGGMRRVICFFSCQNIEKTTRKNIIFVVFNVQGIRAVSM